MRTMLSLVFLWGLAGPLFADGCPEADLNILRQELQRKPARELLFFASWCASCKKSIVAADEQTIFIASFDERPAVEKIVKALRSDGSLRCFYDRGNQLAQHYKVKSLPAIRTP